MTQILMVPNQANSWTNGLANFIKIRQSKRQGTYYIIVWFLAYVIFLWIRFYDWICVQIWKTQKLINVQDGISPYRMENQSKFNKSYMYDYLRPKSSQFDSFLKLFLVQLVMWPSASRIDILEKIDNPNS